MKSALAEALKLRYEPVATLYTNEKPEQATQFAENRWGCVAGMHVAASKGKTVVFDRKTYGCASGGIGIGFNVSMRPNLAEFLSTGSPDQEGEHYWINQDKAQKFINQLPIIDVPEEYVVFMPLSRVETQKPTLVSFYVNADQLSALIVLTNYNRDTTDNVLVAMGAGCHTLCLYALREATKDVPKAVLGMFDITARPFVDPDLLCFTVPYSLFIELESNVEGSFLDHKDWKKVSDRIR